MMPGTVNVRMTMTWLNTLGYKWRKMMRLSEAPISLAAIIKSDWRNESTLPRTSRANTVHDSKAKIQAITTNTLKESAVLGIRAAKAIQRGSCGKAVTNSVKRCKTLSIQPP